MHVSHCFSCIISSIMKTMVSLLLLTALIVSIKCESNEASEELTESFKSLKSNLTIQKYCQIHEDNLKESCLSASDCLAQLNFNHTVCTLMRTSIPECLQPIVGTVASCLKGEGSSFPKFLMQLVVGLSQYFCKLNGETFMEWANMCILEESGYDMELLEKLSDSFGSFADKDELPSKTYICSQLVLLKELTVKHMEAVCFNSITRKFYNGLIDTVITVCGSDNEIVMN